MDINTDPDQSFILFFIVNFIQKNANLEIEIIRSVADPYLESAHQDPTLEHNVGLDPMLYKPDMMTVMFSVFGPRSQVLCGAVKSLL